jgi:tetratricopeptide (TPR) repeat protein
VGQGRACYDFRVENITLAATVSGRNRIYIYVDQAPFGEIWNSPAYDAVRRRLHLGEAYPGCARCGKHDMNFAAARQAYERALEVRALAANPQGWATTQVNLGLVLTSLGERQAGTQGLATLAEARQAFERALEVITRATDAQRWAVTQMNLGNVLRQLGERQGGAEGGGHRMLLPHL